MRPWWDKLRASPLKQGLEKPNLLKSSRSRMSPPRSLARLGKHRTGNSPASATPRRPVTGKAKRMMNSAKFTRGTRPLRSIIVGRPSSKQQILRWLDKSMSKWHLLWPTSLKKGSKKVMCPQSLLNSSRLRRGTSEWLCGRLTSKRTLKQTYLSISQSLRERWTSLWQTRQ